MLKDGTNSEALALEGLARRCKQALQGASAPQPHAAPRAYLLWLHAGAAGEAGGALARVLAQGLLLPGWIGLAQTCPPCLFLKLPHAIPA